jgi:DNA repair exonuclease SbcCD ATPase subunit
LGLTGQTPPTKENTVYVIHLKTNWKGECAHNLSERVLLTGPNGSGKSRVVEAIELCLTGQVSNYAGRSAVKDPKTLWRSKPKAAKTLYIECSLSDGRKVCWEQSRSNGKPAWTVDGEPVTEAPVPVTQTVADLRDNLFGSPAKAEKYLSTVLRIDADSVVKAACAAEPEAAQAITAVFSTVSTTADLLTALSKLGREAAFQAKAAETVGDELEHEVSYVTDAEIKEAQSELRVAQVEEQTVRAVQAQANALSALGTQMIAAQNRLGACPPPPDAAAVAQYGVVHAVAETLRETTRLWPRAASCPCCKQTVAAGHMVARLENLTEYLRSQAALVSQDTVRAGVEAEILHLRQRAQVLRSEMDPMLFSAVISGTHTDETAAVAEESQRARARVDDLQAQRVGAAAPAMARVKAEESAKRAEALKLAAKAVEVAQAKAIKATTKKFAKHTAAFFPAHFGDAKITLRPKVEIGVNRSGVAGIPSGGEEAALLLAMGAVISGAEAETDGNDALRLLVMDDRGLDRKTLEALFAAYGGAWDAGQLFIPTTDRQSAPADWTVIDCWPEGRVSVSTTDVEEKFAALMG